MNGPSVATQSASWLEALLATTSLLAFGVPVAPVGWQVGERSVWWLDMWKGAWDLGTLPTYEENPNMVYPVPFNSRML